jgi:hypothetical protein
MINDPNSAAYRSPQYLAAIGDLRFVADMYQGIRAWIGADGAIADSARLYLPPAPKEEEDNYQRRLYRSSFERRFGNAINTFAGALSKFSITGDLPKQFGENLEDVDLAKTSFTRFLINADIGALRDGVCWILVEYPMSSKSLTYADEAKAGRRPYLKIYQAEDLINLRCSSSGAIELAVFRETTLEQSGLYGQAEVERYRVLVPGGGLLYRLVKNTDSEPSLELENEWKTTIDITPLVPYAITPIITGFQMVLPPPLLDLALLNLHHYRKTSYKDELIMKCNLPILEIEDLVKQGEMVMPMGGQGLPAPKPQIVIGANTVLYNTRSRYVEPTGSALSMAIEDIRNLEVAMSRNTFDFTVQGAPRTATEVAQASADLTANLMSMIASKEAAVRTIFDYWQMYAGGNHSGGIQVDEGAVQTVINSTNVDRLQLLRSAGEISRKTYLTLLKESRVLPQTIDVDAEITQIEQELLKQINSKA